MTKKDTQFLMFQYEDLPLFSGAAPRVPEASFEPQPQPRQACPEPVEGETWGDCRLCLDTGQVNDKPCWCKAGDRLRDTRRRERLIADARGLSSGTIAGLTGLRDYDDVEQVQQRFVGFVADLARSFHTWQEAWTVFEAEGLAVLHP